MRAGAKNRRIEIYASTESAGASRDIQRAWETTATWTVYAHKRTLSAAESTVAAARMSSEDVVFEIWPLDGLTTSHRILCDGEYYDITGIRDPNGDGKQLHVYASSGRQYGAQ
jgi:head-tail adaptor